MKSRLRELLGSKNDEFLITSIFLLIQPLLFPLCLLSGSAAQDITQWPLFLSRFLSPCLLILSLLLIMRIELFR